MAQKTIVTLVDDLDGTPIDQGQGETVKFSLDSTSYEIDLSSDNARELRDAFKTYTRVARSTSARRSTAGAARSNPTDLAAARTWLRGNGHEVSDRGRIPNHLMELYRGAK